MALTTNQIVSREQWLASRLQLLRQEKELTRLRDQLTAARSELPWVLVEKPYRFVSLAGEQSLAELFAECSQLIVYHFMLGPDATEPCKSCSFWAEQYDALRVHLPHRDTQLVVISRAPLNKIEEVRARMGWRFPWVSSLGCEFNQDFGVTFTEEQAGKPLYNFGTQAARAGESPGLSVFVRRNSQVYHTYSAYSRGVDALNGVYQLLDLTPKGRDEADLPWPMAWVQLKDRY